MPGTQRQSTVAPTRTRSLRAEIQALLDAGETRSRAAVAVELVLVGTIAVSVTAVLLETVEPVADVYRGLFATIERLAVALLTLEYALRVWTAPDAEGGAAPDPWQARLR
jgi:voltage-gated potassium channel